MCLCMILSARMGNDLEYKQWPLQIPVSCHHLSWKLGQKNSSSYSAMESCEIALGRCLLSHPNLPHGGVEDRGKMRNEKKMTQSLPSVACLDLPL